MHNALNTKKGNHQEPFLPASQHLYFIPKNFIFTFLLTEFTQNI